MGPQAQGSGMVTCSRGLPSAQAVPPSIGTAPKRFSVAMRDLRAVLGSCHCYFGTDTIGLGRCRGEGYAP
jgi:hypothetical protein